MASTTSGAPRIAVVGGGIGGLTLALALRERGLRADVYEQAAALSEIGAAVALSANATRELDRLGLLPALDAVSTEPTELIWRDGRDGRRVAAFPVRDGGAYRARFGAPYHGIHRADLQRVLGAALGGDGHHLGHRLTAIAEHGAGMRLAFENGVAIEADLVVGADGVRSPLRAFVAGEGRAVYSGTTAFRGIVPIDRLPSLPDPEAIQFWMGPDAHLLHYAIGGAEKAVNFFAVVEGPARWAHGDRWLAPVAPGEPLAGFRGWHPAVAEMIDAVEHLHRWGLFVVAPLRRWHRGRAVLMGDAAHGMLPHHGQGANTTIEDAVTLAGLLAGSPMGPPAAGGPADVDALMVRYEALRRARTRAIQRSSWATNGLLHLGDDADLAGRDARMARFPERFGWIHGFDARRAVAEAAA